MIVILALLAASAFAESKAEADLRLRLAASETARLEASRSLAAALSKLAASQSAATAVAKTGAEKASTAASVDAASGQAAAEAIGLRAEMAAERAAQVTIAAASAAEAAAATAKAQNVALMITLSFGFLTLLSGFLFKEFTASRERRWLKEDMATKHATVLGAVAEASSAANAAYKEANTVNLKLEKIGVQMKDGLPLEQHG